MSDSELFLLFANLGSLYLGYHLGRDIGFDKAFQMLFERAKKNPVLAMGLISESERFKRKATKHGNVS